ncbi:MAG: hypothetical protein RIB59_03540 [Rhodospirillales bacterium]
MNEVVDEAGAGKCVDNTGGKTRGTRVHAWTRNAKNGTPFQIWDRRNVKNQTVKNAG